MTVTLSPNAWPAGEYDRFLADQHVVRTKAGYAEGKNGAVTVAYCGLAARAGLEALKAGGNAIDAAMTAAMMQVVLTAGAPVSLFGIQSLVYYEAKTGKVHCMNAEWNTIIGETDPLSIPGGYDLSSFEGLRGKGPASGRTALVGGFMKGVEAAHRRFGKLPFATLFEPSIYAAENGVLITKATAEFIQLRTEDLNRLPATRAIFKKADGSDYTAGETFRQPALASTLRSICEHGADYMYGGPWGEKLVAAVQADGGKMTLEDLQKYEVIWSDPLISKIDDFELHTAPPPNAGGINMVEAQLLARASGLAKEEHWSKSGASLRKAVEISQMMFRDYIPVPEGQTSHYPEFDDSRQARLTSEHAEALWKAMEQGRQPFKFKEVKPGHSDDVVVIDGEGNIAAITHSANTVMWGRTGINIDGISVLDPASFQQYFVASVPPGSRMPAPTETGIMFKGGKPILGFASMGAGLHQRTMQVLLNFTAFGMPLREAVDVPDFFGSGLDFASRLSTIHVPEGRFDKKVLDETGLAYREITTENARFGSEGLWVGISRDPETGLLCAVSHNRNNSAAVAF